MLVYWYTNNAYSKKSEYLDPPLCFDRNVGYSFAKASGIFYTGDGIPPSVEDVPCEKKMKSCLKPPNPTNKPSKKPPIEAAGVFLGIR